MPSISGVPLPTPINTPTLRTSGQLAFLVSQQWDANNTVSDDITGYYAGQRFIWMVNHVFLSAQR